MEQILEREIPLYKVKCYNDCLYRVTKRLFTPSPTPKAKQKHEDKPVGKFESALSRAKNIVREVSLCNNWDYFVTLTFDRGKWDRYDLKGRVKELMQYIQNLNKQGYDIKYVLVPEFHKDGAVHLHGLMSGIPVECRPEWWPVSVNRKDDGTYYDHCPLFSNRYGYSSVEPVRDMIAVGFYVSKYITKSMAKNADLKGVHTYYRSKALNKSIEVCSLYHENRVLDKCCKFDNSFYKFGFCRFDVGDDFMPELIDEVNDMYQDFVISDPVSGEVVALVGGDTEDEYIQEVLAAFQEQGLRCSVHDMSD